MFLAMFGLPMTFALGGTSLEAKKVGNSECHTFFSMIQNSPIISFMTFDLQSHLNNLDMRGQPIVVLYFLYKRIGVLAWLNED